MGKLKRRGGGGPQEDQYGEVRGHDFHDAPPSHGPSGRAGGAAGGSARRGPDVTFTRALPAFLAPHAHLLGVGTAPARAAAGDADADADFDAAERSAAVAAALRDDATLAADPQLAAAVARARGDEAKDAGNAAFKKGDWEAAVKHYSAAVAAVGADSPDAAPYLANRSAAHGAAKRWDAAFADATAAAKCRPGWPKAWVRVGEAATALKRWSDAVAAYDKAVKLQPDDEKIQIALARARGAETRAVAEGKMTFQPAPKRPRPIAGAAAPPPKKAAVLSFTGDDEDDE